MAAQHTPAAHVRRELNSARVPRAHATGTATPTETTTATNEQHPVLLDHPINQPNQPLGWQSLRSPDSWCKNGWRARPPAPTSCPPRCRAAGQRQDTRHHRRHQRPTGHGPRLHTRARRVSGRRRYLDADAFHALVVVLGVRQGFAEVGRHRRATPRRKLLEAAVRLCDHVPRQNGTPNANIATALHRHTRPSTSQHAYKKPENMSE